MSNPSGDIHGFAGYVVAEAPNGKRRALYVATARWEEEVMEKAEALAADIQAGRTPFDLEEWNPGVKSFHQPT